ncbi:MAG TPA: diguanylate cyclase [Polyangiaceae bacterium]|nr:diguanylate cyclase [Polyangiaceae bacterium]
MDPLVRSALWVQQVITRSSGLVLSFALSGYLVCWAVEPPPLLWSVAAVLLLASSLGYRLLKRLREHASGETTRLDLELFTHLVVLAYGVILHTPGGLDGPYYPAVYALVMICASFAKPVAAAGTLAFAILTEAALNFIAWDGNATYRLLPHAALLGVFAFLNMLVFRAEIARIRALSRQRIETELRKMKDAARSYRLLGAPTAAGERATLSSPDAEERLLRSGVDEIHQAVEFALILLCRTLGLRTALLLGLDAAGSQLHIQELSSTEDGIANGPFSARDGIFGASLAKGSLLAIAGPKAGAHVPYYTRKPAIGAVCATPLLDHGNPRGLLVVDRESREPFSAEEEETLRSAAHFVLRAIENERVFVQLDRAKVEQGKLYRAANALASATTEAQVIEAGVSGAREFAAFDFAVVTLFDKNSGEHEICAVSGDGADELVGQRFKHNSGLVSMVVANRHALPYRGDYDPSHQTVFTRRLSPPAMPSLLVLPLLVHDRALGTLVLGSQRRAAFGDSVRPTLEVLASHVAVSLSNARMLKRLEEMATMDGMTGLFNKRALQDVAVQKLKSAQRFNKPLSMLVCDIDHFKRVNDTYGHDVGDLVIKGFADVLKRVKRDTDAVGRFGGEEFVIVCEETDERGALLLGERIRSELEATSFHTELGPIKVTCSVGAALFPIAGQSFEALFKSTDEALYASKRGGRNRVTLWTPKLQGCAA